MDKADKQRLTRIARRKQKATADYLNNPTPYLTEKYKKAIDAYKNLIADLKRKYPDGEQLKLI